MHGVAGSAAAIIGLAVFCFAIKSNHAEMPAWFGTNLIGRQFPLYRDARVALMLADDRDSILVLLRPECEHRQEIASRWSEVDFSIQKTGLIGVSISNQKWTFMPDTVSASVFPSASNTEVIWDRGVEPAVETPTVIVISDSRVKNVLTGEGAEHHLFGTRPSK